ncbi:MULTISPECIES: STAS domain-containing protein [Thermomonospora]|uniref:Anti-sigma factor antagonist n=1 Tax=Thermomonospora curvata (strain ATCC 19995 / DSM 43183 / JCM 3096 / KCTC 9072 / NBRC 15933 / NCIMB 10081 / Henssen B9) TaxID=471852 RepID=D1A3W8_THECD|nr:MULTISPECIES: STAS domain-containing protein [Thermomonospora]ACY98021.1 anti-sigma-factor antagonist [Thermomonospora curvata DSM 43183]PKK14298.1 MAG: anti-sigma factor antagonist [Thermomonospora sp. CIF 1]
MANTAEILRVKTHRVGLWTVLELTGELDLAGLPALRRRVDEACAAPGPPRLVIDMAAVTFMDSCGLGGLVRCWKRVGERQGRFILVGLRPQVARVLDITGMRRAFESYGSLEEFTRS